MLEDGATAICQSGAIHRYVARKLGTKLITEAELDELIAAREKQAG